MNTLPKEFGKGWMTDNARDLAKIAVTFGGFDPQELALALAKASRRSERINATTVENILSRLKREFDEKERAS